MTLSGWPSPSPEGVSAVAGFDDEDEINAEEPARKGKSAVDGFAIDEFQSAPSCASRDCSRVYLAVRALPLILQMRTSHLEIERTGDIARKERN